MTAVKKGKESRAKTGPVTLLDGYKDRILEDAPYWDWVERAVERMRRDFGYQRLETPVVEDVRLYTLPKNTPVYDEGYLMSVSTAQDGTALVLRPDSILGLARAFREHGYTNLPQPIKTFFTGPHFRNEQKTGSGTYKQFTQFGFVLYGDPQSVVDAQLISAYYFLFQELGLDVQLQLNSIGHPECRAQYERQLMEYFRTKRAILCDACKEKLANKQPLKMLACTEEQCQEAIAEAPQIVDHLCDADREHFVKVLEHLDEVEVPYELNPRLVRNPALYTKTVVEFRTVAEGRAPFTVAAGGRQDQLVQAVGGPATASFSLVGGFERIIKSLKEQQKPAEPAPAPDIFLAQLGDAARRRSLQLFLKLRTEGISVAENLSKEGIKGQLENAAVQRAKFALILGQKEIMDGTILLRDMENGIQETLDFQKVIPEIKKRLEKSGTASMHMPVMVDPAVVQHSVETPPATE